MDRLTWTSPNGDWGLTRMTEEELRSTGSRIYAALYKLKDYEDTGITPSQIRELDKQYTQKCKELAKVQTELRTYKQMEEKQSKEEKKIEYQRK